MPVTFLTAATAGQFKERLRAIPADGQPRFGKLQPPALMRHLRKVLEVSLEEVKEPDISNIMTRSVLRYLFFHVFTNWPKGKIKAPDSFTPEPEGAFEEEREKALAAVDRFVVAQQENPARKTLSPLLGPITLAYWGRVHGIHMEHHFKQYGV